MIACSLAWNCRALVKEAKKRTSCHRLLEWSTTSMNACLWLVITSIVKQTATLSRILLKNSKFQSWHTKTVQRVASGRRTFSSTELEFLKANTFKVWNEMFKSNYFFVLVNRHEKNALLHCLNELKKKYNDFVMPGYTLIVAQRNNGFRVFPANPNRNARNDADRNLKPGTLINSGLVNPVLKQFVLVAHRTIQVCFWIKFFNMTSILGNLPSNHVHRLVRAAKSWPKANSIGRVELRDIRSLPLAQQCHGHC